MTSKSLDVISQERQDLYGDPDVMFHATGVAVTAIIEAHYGIILPHTIPPHVIAQIDVVKKAVRAAASTRYNEDDYVDEQNYVRLAHKLDKRKLKDE